MTNKLKLLPREATREMLEAMDECSMEGYDERLYAGHAGSVYMAAWDAFYGQHCYCGDITSLGVIHRNDGPCHYPEHTSEYKRGYADAMNWKVQNHLEHLQPKEPEQEPVAQWIEDAFREGWASCRDAEFVGEDEEDWQFGNSKANSRMIDLQQSTPPQRKPLTDEEIILIVAECAASHQHTDIHFARAIERAHGIKELV